MKFLSKNRISRSRQGDILIFVFLLCIAAFTSLPLLYAVMSSLKPPDELWIFPPRFFVRNPTFKNFTDLWNLMGESWVPFSRYIFNTVFITVAGTAGHIIVASMCAYPLALYKFPFSKTFTGLVVTSLMFTGAVTGIPSYIILSQIGFVDTYLAILIPVIGGPLGLFLMRQFMEANIPQSLLESADIDGAGELVKLYKIVMPLVKPAWLTLMIYSVQGLWNIGNNPFIYTESLKTLSYALSQISAAGIARAGVGSAISVLMLAVPLVVFIINQSNVIETMATSGIKD